MFDARAGGVRLLVSVRDAREAATAVDAGVDIIDVKEPGRGPLGMANAHVVSKIVAGVAGRAPVTMAMGELTQWLAAGASLAVPAGVSFVKMGLAGAPGDWRERLRASGFVSGEVGACKAVAVAYADNERVCAPHVRDVLSWALASGAPGLLIDTAVKDGRGLFEWMSEAEVSGVIGRAQQGGVFVALAGSLAGDSLRAAAALLPDIVAVRGAACVGRDRNAVVDAGAIAQAMQTIARHSVSTARRGD
jgi:uncharacterized protein (UPF0264 family)